MTDLVVRRLLVDMEAPIPRHWCGNDPFRSAFFNALSMSFPVGEQFFMDSVRNAFKALPAEKQAQFDAEVKGFVGQEATHRRLHALYNAHLDTLGLPNAWEPRAKARIRRLEGLNPRHAVAATAANEHFTAIFATWLLHNPEVLASTDERLSTLWLWHASEEAEHRCTAFDLYKALGGNEKWRLRWFRLVTFFFLTDALRQTMTNLRADGTLWRRATWASAWRHLFGKQGLIRQTFGPWRDYFKADFHPSHHDASASLRWLEDNRARYQPVGQPAAPAPVQAALQPAAA